MKNTILAFIVFTLILLTSCEIVVICDCDCERFDNNRSINSLVMQPDSIDGVDTYVHSANRYLTLNFGNSDLIRASSWTDFINDSPEADSRILIKFEELNDFSSQEIVSVILTLYSYENFPYEEGGQHGENSSVVFNISEQWEENKVTWNTQPAFNVVDSVVIPQNNEYDSISVDITKLVKNMYYNNYGFLIKQVNESPYSSLVFSSSDATDVRKRPKLSIKYIR